VSPATAPRSPGCRLAASTQCLAYEPSHCTEDAAHYALRIEWDSEEGHLRGFRTSPEFKSLFTSVQPYVKDMEEMRHNEVLLADRKPT
jgi:quinol monooxygenase YgiN